MEIQIELAWETQAIQITVRWSFELQGAEADVIQSLVVKLHACTGVLGQPMEKQDRVVWLHNNSGDLVGRNDKECLYDTVWVLLTHIRN